MLTTKDLAKRWGVCVQHLANLRTEGKGPPYKKPLGRVLYDLKDIEDFENDSRN